MRNNRAMTRARDELFSHINRCGVLQAGEDDQLQWMKDTIEFIAERYAELSEQELQQLHDVGLQFCQPAIPHGADRIPDNTATGAEDANVA